MHVRSRFGIDRIDAIQRIVTVLALVGLALCSTASMAAEVRDDRGERVFVADGGARRIVALAAHFVDVLSEVSAIDRLVAADANARRLLVGKNVTLIDAMPPPSPERILALRPDLVLAWRHGIARDWTRRVREAGVPVYVTSTDTLDGIGKMLVDMSVLLGDSSTEGLRAARTAHAWRVALEALRNRYSSRAPVRVVYQIWRSPLIVAGGRGFIDDALKACGARNVFADLRVTSATVGREAVIVRRPELVLTSDIEGTRAMWEGFGLVSASGPTRFAAVDDRRLHRPSPTMLGALRRLCDSIDQARTALHTR